MAARSGTQLSDSTIPASPSKGANNPHIIAMTQLLETLLARGLKSGNLILSCQNIHMPVHEKEPERTVPVSCVPQGISSGP